MLICVLAELLSNTITLQYTLNYFEQNKWHLTFQAISKGGMCEIDKQTKGELELAVELILVRGRINGHACIFLENNRRRPGLITLSKKKRKKEALLATKAEESQRREK